MTDEKSVPRTHARTYTTVTELGDFGPWVHKLVLAMPGTVDACDVDARTFNVFCERRERADGSVVMRRERGADHAAPSVGYVEVLAAYPSDAEGNPCGLRGDHVTLELPEVRLTKTIEGNVFGSRLLDNHYRVTQLTPLPGEVDPLCGLVFDTCAGDVCPGLHGWQVAQAGEAAGGISYGYYTPSFDEVPAGNPFVFSHPRIERAPLIVWLHGAGEGVCGHPGETERAYIGNRVTALSDPKIQNYFGGAAWVVAPQSPTFWMDSQGDGQVHEDNGSIYSRPLKALIDEFVAAHEDQVDTSRIVVGGLSNGGLMTARLIADNPGFFAAAIPTCMPFYSELASDEEIAAMAQTPVWFVHSKGDELVDPKRTALAVFPRVRAAGGEAHLTYFDHVEDLTGRYREADGSPKRTFNHGVWIHVFNDFCRTDLDGTNVMVDGEPVGVWEWAAAQRRA